MWGRGVMGKFSLSIGSKVFYKDIEHIIMRTVDFNTLSIAPMSDQQQIFNVNINDLSPSSVTDNVQLDYYGDEAWSEAKKKYEAIEHLVFKQKKREEVEDVAAQCNVSVMTVYRWIKSYEESEKISSLISNKHKRGKQGSRIDPLINKVVEDIIEEKYLTKQRIGFSKLYHAIDVECKKLKIATPHENTIRNRIKQIDPEVMIRKRFSPKKALEKYGNFEGAYPEGNFPLEVFQVDHTPLDIILVDSVSRKPIGRPYLTLALDVYSRMVAGFYLSLQAPGYFSVSQCLYNAFLPKEGFLKKYGIKGEWEIYGIPSKYAVDNGKDLIGVDMQRVCDELGITMVRRPVARPQFGAHVERVFGTINKAVHNLPGSTFSNISEKSDYDSVKNATFTLEEMTKWLIEFIVNVYHNRTHHGLGMSPKQKYHLGVMGDEDNPGTGLPPILDNYESIRIALLPTFYRTVQKDGITLDGISYYSDILRTWINKEDTQGNKLKFKVKRDPLSIKKLYFFDPDLNEYFELHYRKLHAPDMTLWDLYAARRYLKERHAKNLNEDEIFEANERLNQIEKEAKDKTTQHKHQLRKSKAPKMADIKKHQKAHTPVIEYVEQEEDSKGSTVFDGLFDDIETFEIKE